MLLQKQNIYRTACLLTALVTIIHGDIWVRELLTFTAIISIGGCDPQAKAHAAGNLSVGNTKKLLIETVTTCLPYIGYPRTLNALTCIEEVCK